MRQTSRLATRRLGECDDLENADFTSQPHAKERFLEWTGRNSYNRVLAGAVLRYRFRVEQAGEYDFALWNLKGGGASDAANDVFWRLVGNTGGIDNAGWFKLFTNQKNPPKWSFRVTLEDVDGRDKFSNAFWPLKAGEESVCVSSRVGTDTDAMQERTRSRSLADRLAFLFLSCAFVVEKAGREIGRTWPRTLHRMELAAVI